jgi:O-antigen ligase
MTKISSIFEEKSPLEVILWASLAGCLLFALISISAEQVCLGLAIIAWAILLIRKERRMELPPFVWPLIAYVVLSLLASAFSRDPATSFIDSKELLLTLIIPVAMSALFSARSARVIIWAFLASAGISIVYSLAYFVFRAAWGERVKGFMGHYMTQAGLLMLFASAALALVLFLKDRSRWWWGLGFVLCLPALGLTLTRSAWIGLVAAACFLLFLYRPVTVVVVPVLIGLFFLAGPQNMKRRALSIFSRTGYSNAERIEYFRAGVKIIKENPWLGTGPRTVDKVFQYPEYGLSEQAKRNVHLHSNMVQLAAERGLPALAAWLAFLAWALAALSRLFKSPDPTIKAAAAAAMSVVVALFIGGFFEYNFGDSEITVLLYFLLAYPFALERIGRREAGMKAQGPK